MDNSIKTLNKFINYIKEQSEDISKNGNSWDKYDIELVKNLHFWLDEFDVKNSSYPAPQLKNNKYYVLTDLWKLLAFVRGIWGTLYTNWLEIANSFDEFIKLLYRPGNQNTQCKKSVDYICTTKTENCPKSATTLFNNIRKSLLDKSYYYMRTSSSNDDLQRDIGDFNKKFKTEINDFKSKNKLTDEQYKNCLFPFLDRMNCYFDNIPLLPELKINKNNEEFNYKYEGKSTY